jgi:hypothetical protein
MELNLAKNHKAEHTHLNVTSRRFLEISTSIDKADLRNLGSGLPSNLLDWKFACNPWDKGEHVTDTLYSLYIVLSNIFLSFLCSVLLLTEASMEKGIREDDQLTSATELLLHFQAQCINNKG